jgi:K(+)-stimulated pyrophosphate-energized sodium pump
MSIGSFSILVSVFENSFSNTLFTVGISGALALLASAIFGAVVHTSSVGSEKMEGVAKQIRRSAAAFLRQVSLVTALFVLIVAVVLYVFVDSDLARLQLGVWVEPYASGSFALGALCSMVAGWIIWCATTTAGGRSAQAARTSLVKALRIVFLGGITSGLAVVGLSILGLTGAMFFLVEVQDVSVIDILQMLIGFCLGAAVVTLFARVGGGIFALSVDLAGTKAQDAESSVEDPMTLMSSVGSGVGQSVGRGADLFESFTAAIVATMLIGVTTAWSESPDSAILFPLFIVGLGVVASILSSFFVRSKPGTKELFAALKGGTFLCAALVIVGSFLFTQNLLPGDVALGVFLALVSGLIVGLIVGMLSEYHTSPNFQPVRDLAKTARAGAGSVIAGGLTLGALSTFLPVFFVLVAIAVAYMSAGLYGIAIAAVGTLSMLAFTVASHAFGPIAENAGRVTELAKLQKQVRSRTDILSATGETAEGMAGSIAIGSSFLIVLAFFSVFLSMTSLETVDLTNPLILIGLFVGGALPFLFSSMTVDAALRLSARVPEWSARKSKASDTVSMSRRTLDLVTGVALKEALLPGLLAALAPVAVGLTLGTEALAALLIGALLSSVLTSFSMTNAGSAWQSAKRYILSGNLGGKGSDTYAAALASTTVGGALKGVAGSSVLILLRFMMIVSLLTVGLYTPTGFLF